MTNKNFNKKSIGQEMADMANACAEESQSLFQLELDYSPSSLQVVDQLLPIFHSRGFVFPEGHHAYSAYVGEVVRRVLGGEWQSDGDQGEAKLIGVGGNVDVKPFQWLVERMESVKGRVRTNLISDAFDELLALLDRSADEPQRIPIDFVAKKHGVDLNAIQDEEFYDSGVGPDDIDEMEDDEPSTELSDEDKREWLASCPLACFSILTVLNRKLKKKEQMAFIEGLNSRKDHANPLVREIFSNAESRLPLALKSLMEDSRDLDAIAMTLRLVACKSIAHEMAPDHATGFFEALYDLSKEVASSAGGFFGFGKKINKSEAMALEAIANIFGLSK